MTGNDDMKSETTVVWQWLRINVPTLLAIGGLVWYTADNNARTIARINAIEVSRIDRSKEADHKFAALNTSVSLLAQKVDPLGNVTYRVGVVEGQVTETNKRLDRLAETIVNSLDLIRRDVNGLSTRIEVLSNKVDGIIPQRRTGLETQTPPELVR